MNLSLRLVTILNYPMDQEKLQADQVRFQDHGRPLTNPKWLVLDLPVTGDIQLYRRGVYFHGSYIGSHQEATPSTFHQRDRHRLLLVFRSNSAIEYAESFYEFHEICQAKCHL
jgi:hypothetical protein